MTVAVSLILVAIIFILCLVIPACIGVYVYRDSKKRRMNPVLWTLLAVLAPGFVGLIIYLVVRVDHSAMSCPQCGAAVSERFAVCPSCGFSLKNNCPRCGMPLEPDWNICPGCANPVPPEMKAQNPVRPKKDKSISWLLALVVLIPILLCVVLICSITMFRVTDNASYSAFGTPMVAKSSVSCSNFEMEEWFRNCDAQGKGVYVLTETAYEGESTVLTKVLVYRNDGMYDITMDASPRGMFRSPELTLDCVLLADDAYTLSYFEYEGAKTAQITVETDGEENDFLSWPVGDLTVNTEPLTITLSIPGTVKNVAFFDVCLYSQNEVISSGGTQASDGDALSGTVGFELMPWDCARADAFSVSISDADGELIAESDMIPLDEDDLPQKVVMKLTYEDGEAKLVMQ